MSDKNKLIVLVSGVLVILLMVFGISFAIFRFGDVSTNQELVLGDIWMKYEESNGIQLENALPGDEYTNYFEFTITGTNTYTKKDIYYDISLTHGDIPAGKEESNRVEDKYLKFKLTEVNGDIETEIFTDKTYDDLTNKRVHVDTISKSTSTYSKTYRLYMVISEELTYGNSSDAILTTEEFGKIFGSVKVNVTGDFNEKEVPKEINTEIPAAEAILVDLVSYENASASDFEGGLVAINGTEGSDYGLLYNENNDTHTIREYRYSGADVDNYIYYNCPDTAGDKTYGDLDYDYANNCETWRIVGIFNENGEEFLKIMNNNTLTGIPKTYTYNEMDYTLSDNGTKTAWDFEDNSNNNWATSGLQYYLNTEYDNSVTPIAGYLSTLSTTAKNLIRETSYYLGNVNYDTDTTISAYINERNVSSDNLHSGNEPTWNGKVALLYPSDYGYSATSMYWNGENILYEYNNLAASTSWMQQTANHIENEWLLSPVSFGIISSMLWLSTGKLHNDIVFYKLTVARPVLYLKSETKVLKGDGTEDLPYVIVSE